MSYGFPSSNWPLQYNQSIIYCGWPMTILRIFRQLIDCWNGGHLWTKKVFHKDIRKHVQLLKIKKKWLYPRLYKVFLKASGSINRHGLETALVQFNLRTNLPRIIFDKSRKCVWQGYQLDIVMATKYMDFL